MDEAEIKKLYDALGPVTGLENEITNLLQRGPGALKGWTEWMSHTKNPANAKTMRESLKLLSALLKDGKKVIGDLHKTAAAVQRKNLVKYPTAKSYHDKNLKALLAPAHKWGDTAKKFMDAVGPLTQPIAKFPNDKSVPENTTWTAMSRYQVYHQEMREALAKL